MVSELLIPLSVVSAYELSAIVCDQQVSAQNSSSSSIDQVQGDTSDCECSTTTDAYQESLHKLKIARSLINM